MTEVTISPYEASSPARSFDALEFTLPTVSLEDLASGMGRYGIFNALLTHQRNLGLDPHQQAWAGINGASLVKNRTLFSEANPQADPSKFNANFYATRFDHWQSIIGEVQYSPFTYIYKGSISGATPYPTIVGFDRDKIVPLYSRDDENVNWHPVTDETVESALKSIYYFPGLFQD